MKRASLSEAKNGLLELLDEVRRGETVLITHHGKPVAQLVPYRTVRVADDAGAELVRRGIASPPRTRLDVDRFLAAPVPRLAEGVSAVRTVIAERNDSP